MPRVAPSPTTNTGADVAVDAGPASGLPVTLAVPISTRDITLRLTTAAPRGIAADERPVHHEIGSEGGPLALVAPCDQSVAPPTSFLSEGTCVRFGLDSRLPAWQLW